METGRIGDPLDDAELAIVVRCWPSLSRSAKDAILRVVAKEGGRP